MRAWELAVRLLLAGGIITATARAELHENGLGRLDFRQTVQRAKEQVFPSLVFIRCLQTRFEAGSSVSQEISGSGVIISDDGEVLTNWHVIEKADRVRCQLYDGRVFEAKVLGSDKDVDLALLKLQRAASLPRATLGDSSRLREGDFVMAMGAPWGMTRSVSIGIICCTRRMLQRRSEYSLWLQTDASISPGNSGGPLINTDGQVIGINTLGMWQGGDTGFALPSETISALLPQLRQHGRVLWSWTGMRLQPLKDFNRDIYFDATNGVMIAETDADSPARRAGLQPGDRLLKVGDRCVTAVSEEDLPSLSRFLGLLPRNQPVRLELARAGKDVAAELTPIEKGKVEGDALDCPRWGFTVKAINQFDTPNLFYHRERGVFVFGVKEIGNAARAGLRPMDILLKADDQELASLDQIRALYQQSLRGLPARHRVVLTVLRNGLARQVALDYAQDYDKE
jgi:serine protease Do